MFESLHPDQPLYKSKYPALHCGRVAKFQSTQRPQYDVQQIAAQLKFFEEKIAPRYHTLTPKLKAQVQKIFTVGTNAIRIQTCRDDFLRYVKHMWVPLGIPEAYKEGIHHRMMADAFNRIAKGELKRLILAMPPRSGKSTFASEALPTWYLGKFPGRYVMQVSNGKRLASKFGAKVRDMFDTAEFKEIFPGIALSKSTKGKEVFNTNKKGRYVALSMEAKKAGEGGHLLIIDDPHSEEDVVKMISNKNIWEDAWQRYLGIRQRAQKNVAIVVIMTRWNSSDITGRLLKLKEKGTEDWEVIEFPAILDEGTENERSFWEDGKPIEDLRQERAVTPKWKWNAVYQQKPMDEGGSIIPRDSWREWTKKDEYGRPRFPKFSYVIQAWDTAQSSKDIANASACTTWGLFFASQSDEDKKQYSLMLCDGIQGRWDFPELKARAIQMNNRWNPDVLIIEEKQSGPALRTSLGEVGIFAIPFVPSRGSFKMPNDKMARLNAISDLFRANLVYAPLDEPWASDVRESCATAGFGGSDDYADTVAMALKRFREGRFIMLPEEMRVMRERETQTEKVDSGPSFGYW